MKALITTEKDTLEGYFALRSLDGDRIDVPDSGVLVPRRFWEHYAFDVGDRVPAYDSGMNRSDLAIAGVFENYYGQLFFLSPQGYEEIFGTAPQTNCYFVKTGGMTINTLREKLAGVEGVQKVNDAWAERHMIEQFTAETGIEVKYEEATTAEELYTKYKSGGISYDLICTSGLSQ